MSDEVIHIETTLVAKVSRHNSDDDGLVDEITAKMEALANEIRNDPKYASLQII